jgi:hypothetical protein
MRASEFLTEYNQDITVQKLGPALFQAIKKDKTTYPIMGRIKDMKNEPHEQTVILAVRMFAGADPTENNQYTEWLIRTYIREWNTGRGTKFEDVASTVQDYLEKFYKLTRRKMIEPPANDINRYRTFKEFLNIVSQYPDPQPTEKEKGRATEIYQDNSIRVIVPEDQTAACYYGQGTQWCTSTTKGANYFDAYSSQAPLFIVLPLKPQHVGEKYQLHFVYSIGDRLITSDDDYDEAYYEYGEDYIIDNERDSQFMDERDDPVDMHYLHSRFGASMSNLEHAIIAKYPQLEFAINQAR